MNRAFDGPTLSPQRLENSLERAAHFRNGPERRKAQVDQLIRTGLVKPAALVDLEQGARDVARIHHLVEDGNQRDQPADDLGTEVLVFFEVAQQQRAKEALDFSTRSAHAFSPSPDVQPPIGGSVASAFSIRATP
ncbi:hypothetical protein FQZ97_1060180 [compost metagenome]